MSITDLNIISFSPTHSTSQIVKTISDSLSYKNIHKLDLTKASSKEANITCHKNSLTIIAVPVYGGRVPLDAVNRLSKIKGNNSAVAIIAVYGNRAYEDCLLELKDIATECKFNTIAAATFITQHTFSSEENPIGKNRPDKNDITKIKEFSKLLSKKVTNINDLESLNEIKIPGNFPYRERGKNLLIAPRTDESICTKCKACELACPVNAITVGETVITDNSLCILCNACVKVCDPKARIFDDPIIKNLAIRLSNNCKERKEPEFFFAN